MSSSIESGAPLRIAVLDDFQGVALAGAGWGAIPRAEVTAFCDHVDDPSALVRRLASFDVVCLMRERTALPASVLAQLPRLKLIVTTGMWNASLDIAAALRQGIVISGTTAVQSGTPELTWLLMLALARRLPREQASMAVGGWQTGVGEDLEGSTLGLLGLGRIGARVARVANAFGLRVLAWSRHLTDEAARECGATRMAFDELLRASDFVSIHLKLSERTRGLIGVREFALMKPTAFLVNTSRGPIVSEPALLQALRTHRIAGAGLDVFDIEPLPPAHPLRTMPEVIATPHIGYVTRRTYAGFFAQMVEDIRAWRDDAPVRLLAAPQAVSPEPALEDLP